MAADLLDCADDVAALVDGGESGYATMRRDWLRIARTKNLVIQRSLRGSTPRKGSQVECDMMLRATAPGYGLTSFKDDGQPIHPPISTTSAAKT